MTGNPLEPEVELLPYERLASGIATDFIKDFEEEFGNDPRVLRAYLPSLLSFFALDCIETGLGLADHFPTTGPVDIMEAYIAGTEQAKKNGRGN